jgi:hypothetical protein
MFNIQNFNNLISIKEVDIDNPFLIYLEHIITKEKKEEEPTITTGLLSRHTEIANWSEISIVPTKKEIELTNNLKNYSEKDFKKLIINKIREQANINLNSKDYPEKLKCFNYENHINVNNMQNDMKQKSSKEIHDLIERWIIAKIHNCSNLIAVNSRIGPANTIIMHYDCYKEFDIFKQSFFNYKVIIDNTIDKKEIIIYRLEPQIESSGMVLVYNKTNNNFTIESFLSSSPKYFSILNLELKFKKEIRGDKLKNLIIK